MLWSSVGGEEEMSTAGPAWKLKLSDEDGEAEEKEPTLP